MPVGLVPTVRSVPFVGTIGFERLIGETLAEPAFATNANNPLGEIAMPDGLVPTVRSVPFVGTIGFERLIGETLAEL
jgi:hypothetical protein